MSNMWIAGASKTSSPRCPSARPVVRDEVGEADASSRTGSSAGPGPASNEPRNIARRDRSATPSVASVGRRFGRARRARRRALAAGAGGRRAAAEPSAACAAGRAATAVLPRTSTTTASTARMGPDYSRARRERRRADDPPAGHRPMMRDGAAGAAVTRPAPAQRSRPTDRMLLGSRHMGNTLKTTVLLGALSGLLLFIGDLMGGQSGLVIGSRLRRGDEHRLLLVLGQDRAGDVPGPAGRARTIRCTRSSQRLAQRAGLPMPKVYIIPDASPNAFATGRNPRARGRRGHRGHPAAPERGRARRRHRARARARQAPRHPDQLGRRDDRRGDHDVAARFADVLRRRPLGRPRRRQQPDRAARHDDPGAAGGDADPGGDLALARVRRRRRRRGDRRRAARAGERAAQARDAARSGCRSTPTRRRRTCSSSSRSRPAACSRCSARIRRPSSGSPP